MGGVVIAAGYSAEKSRAERQTENHETWIAMEEARDRRAYASTQIEWEQRERDRADAEREQSKAEQARAQLATPAVGPLRIRARHFSVMVPDGWPVPPPSDMYGYFFLLRRGQQTIWVQANKLTAIDVDPAASATMCRAAARSKLAGRKIVEQRRVKTRHGRACQYTGRRNEFMLTITEYVEHGQFVSIQTSYLQSEGIPDSYAQFIDELVIDTAPAPAPARVDAGEQAAR